jgi:Bacteriorhodopsin
MVYEAITAGGFGSQPFILAYIITAMISGLLFLYLPRKLDVPQKFGIIHFFIVVWSGLMYTNFLNQSFLSDYAWYMDWMVSTPLILLALGLTAFHGADTKRYDLLGALLGAEFTLVITGLLAQAQGSITPYYVGVLLLLGVVYLLAKPFREIAEESSDGLARAYKILAGYIGIFFLSYPTVWYISGIDALPGGLNILDPTQTSIALVVLPFFCKQVYGFLDMYLIHKAE